MVCKVGQNRTGIKTSFFYTEVVEQPRDEAVSLIFLKISTAQRRCLDSFETEFLIFYENFVTSHKP